MTHLTAQSMSSKSTARILAAAALALHSVCTLADDRRVLPDSTLRHGSAARAVGVRPEASTLVPAEPLRTQLERLSENELKLIYLRCSFVATQRRLDGCEIATCSVASDVMIQRYFAGSFDALRSWSAAQGEDYPEGRDRNLPLCGS